MKRERMLRAVREQGSSPWDIIIIGGGATGLGTALDAAARGYKTLLLEQSDFAKGTSSRSTKLVHGGVRYLARGEIALVLEALHERGLLLNNAPHLVTAQSFIIPIYSRLDRPLYTLGMKMYDAMAGNLGFGKSRFLTPKQVLRALPKLKAGGLHGGVLYYDGQFDDARMAVHIARTCVTKGGTVLNYMQVTGLVKTSDGTVCGVTVEDRETGNSHTLKARCVVNATGVFVDGIIRMDEENGRRLVRPSQGVHIVLDTSFLPGDSALLIPRTTDKRVLFAIPWHGRIIVGTTDTPMDNCSLEPRALEEEIDFILLALKNYLSRSPGRADILSVFAGLRPLAAPDNNRTGTRDISRKHYLQVSSSGLVTITGGKWTTYRKMAEDTVDKAAAVAGLARRRCRTENMAIHGSRSACDHDDPLCAYGEDADYMRDMVTKNPQLGKTLHKNLPFTQVEVLWSARHEMARSVEDILARRQRALFLDARAAVEMAPEVARILATELKRGEEWQRRQVQLFTQLARGYLPKNHDDVGNPQST